MTRNESILSRDQVGRVPRELVLLLAVAEERLTQGVRALQETRDEIVAALARVPEEMVAPAPQPKTEPTFWAELFDGDQAERVPA